MSLYALDLDQVLPLAASDSCMRTGTTYIRNLTKAILLFAWDFHSKNQIVKQLFSRRGVKPSEDNTLYIGAVQWLLHYVHREHSQLAIFIGGFHFRLLQILDVCLLDHRVLRRALGTVLPHVITTM